LTITVGSHIISNMDEGFDNFTFYMVLTQVQWNPELANV